MSTPTQRLPYFSLRSPPSKSSPFQQPLPLVTFSYTPVHILEFTDSALRYFVDPPAGADLNFGYERWVRRPVERGRLDSLLKAWAATGGGRGEGDRVGVVAWRGIMTKILTAVYEDRDGWELNVMCANGTMFFEEYLSTAKLQEKENMTPHGRLQSYYGYAFEAYCTSSAPPQGEGTPDPPGWGGDVNTNVQWCCVVKTKLGDTRIVIGGEVDCVRGAYDGTTSKLVELKTSKAIRHQSDERNFERKLLKFYIQSFLLGVPEILVGFRTPSGILTRVQPFKTIQIPRMVRGKPNAWDPLICLAWGDHFLSFLKRIITPGKEGRSCVWRVKFIPRVGVEVRVLGEEDVADVAGGDGEVERVGFLPKWFWDEMCGEREEDKEPQRKPESLPPGWQI